MYLAETTVDNLTDIGVSGILVVLVLREVFGFLRKRNGVSLAGVAETIGRIETDLATLKTENHELHVWHDVSDQEGGKIWYVRKGLQEAVVDLKGAIEAQTGVLRTMGEAFKDLSRDVKAQTHAP